MDRAKTHEGKKFRTRSNVVIAILVAVVTVAGLVLVVASLAKLSRASGELAEVGNVRNSLLRLQSDAGAFYLKSDPALYRDFLATSDELARRIKGLRGLTGEERKEVGIYLIQMRALSTLLFQTSSPKVEKQGFASVQNLVSLLDQNVAGKALDRETQGYDREAARIRAIVIGNSLIILILAILSSIMTVRLARNVRTGLLDPLHLLDEQAQEALHFRLSDRTIESPYREILSVSQTIRSVLKMVFTTLNRLPGLGLAIADTDMGSGNEGNRILYANDTMQTLYQAMRSDLEKFTGRSLPPDLVGLSIHQFHRDPDLVRKDILAIGPDQVRTNAVIPVGPRFIFSQSFTLVDEERNPRAYVTGLSGRDPGKRTGTRGFKTARNQRNPSDRAKSADHRIGHHHHPASRHHLPGVRGNHQGNPAGRGHRLQSLPDRRRPDQAHDDPPLRHGIDERKVDRNPADHRSHQPHCRTDPSPGPERRHRGRPGGRTGAGLRRGRRRGQKARRPDLPVGGRHRDHHPLDRRGDPAEQRPPLRTRSGRGHDPGADGGDEAGLRHHREIPGEALGALRRDPLPDGNLLPDRSGHGLPRRRDPPQLSGPAQIIRQSLRRS
ncbi:MAG: hypothetical protein D084_Lepto4C00288G0003 [Leptospirillum sp. Group IV 'UBA BS']|nr:MAG: hypothetical protein D084_Lepto4C00288G0003 [Leptospirillum sp. Group IV 'UBA BS']